MTLKQSLTALIASFILLLFTGCIGEQTTFDPDKVVSAKEPIHANNKVDVRPVFISSNIANVNENQTSAITLVATDDSVPIYSISEGDSASFTVDATTGVVTFIVAPDFETKNIYTFLATATDIFANTTSMRVTINIINQVDIAFTSSNIANVNENQTSAITLVTTNDSVPIYSISGGDSASFRVDANTGVVTFIVAPNFEIKNIYTFNATATDIFANTTTMTVTINIINLVETVFTSSNIANVNENQTSAITLVATDDSPLIYSISEGDSASFTVDATAGVVTFIVAPDFETKNIYTFLATATDIYANTTSMRVTINIINLPDIVSTLANSTASVDENATIGTEFGIVTITDVGDSNITAFTLSDTTNFEVDVAGGIKTKTTLDYETTTKYDLRVYATNGAGNSVSVDLNISINDIGGLYTKSAVYNNNATATTADDKLYIYFNRSIDETTISVDTSANYVINGTGAIGSASASDYNDTFFHRHTIAQDDGSTGSLAISTAGDTNISMAINTIADMKGEHPTDYNEIEVEKFNLLSRLQTGQTTSYPNGNATDRDDRHYQSSNARSYSLDGVADTTVIDNATGLIWQRTDDNTRRNWATAKTYCEDITLNGNSDFRLPNQEELMSITDASRLNPSIDPVFVGTKNSEYWCTSTSFTTKAWYVRFSYGDSNWYSKVASLFVRCVR